MISALRFQREESSGAGTSSISRVGVRAGKMRLSDCAVFFDFDNTITRFDVIDDVLERFSVDRKWLALEEAWKAGRIGSKECLEGQLRSVRATKKEMRRYLSTVPIDPSFSRLVALLKKNKIRPTILSDSFTFFIKEILKNHGIAGVKVYCNELTFSKSVLSPLFPFANGCARCAHCKKQHLLDRRWKNKIIVYVGDGLSDVCPAEHADVVFAKESLLRHCRRNKIPCVEFKDLRDVHHYLRRKV